RQPEWSAIGILRSCHLLACSERTTNPRTISSSDHGRESFTQYFQIPICNKFSREIDELFTHQLVYKWEEALFTYSLHLFIGYGGSYAVSGAAAGGHGQAQSQSAAFALGPYSASFSQSQAQGGRRGIFDLFDY
ncbi:unnamed protein product, partial [Callosobruchus maculatus]